MSTIDAAVTISGAIFLGAVAAIIGAVGFRIYKAVITRMTDAERAVRRISKRRKR